MYAMVNPEGNVAETVVTNNTFNWQHQGPVAHILPADTTVTRKQGYTLRFSTEHFTPASHRWSMESGSNQLSCTTCPSPDIMVLDTSVVKVALTNPYGCEISTTAKSQQFPTDLVITIRDVKCYDNARTIVSYQVCMQNGYDVVYGGIPVTFYDGPGAKRWQRPIQRLP